MDALAWADDLIVLTQKRGAQDLKIPHVVFNIDNRNDDDYFASIKAYDRSVAAIVERFTNGNSRDPSVARMSLYEIFQWIDHAFRSDLAARGIIDSGVDLFVDSEIQKFDGIQPPKTVFQSVGIASAVRRLVESNLPDWEVAVDPRTRQWRFFPSHKDMISGGFGTVVSVSIDKLTLTLGAGETDHFDMTGDGSSVRIQNNLDRRFTETKDIESIDAGLNQITLKSPLLYDYEAGDFAIPMFAQEDRVPSVGLDLTESEQNTLREDVDGVATAVSITSIKQTAERIKAGPEGSSSGNIRVQPGYDDDFHTDYNRGRHEARTDDRGIDGMGIIIDEIVSFDSGGGVMKTHVWFSEEHSQFGNDHDELLAAGNSEWTGTICHFLTSGGEVSDISGQNLSGEIESFVREGWMDSPTNEIRRFKLTLDRDILAINASIQSQVGPGNPDRFEMSGSDLFAPSNPNQRNIVGRSWRVESTTEDDDARDIDDSCPAVAVSPSLQGGTVPQIASPANQLNPNLLTWAGQQAHWQLNPATNPFAQITMWRLEGPPEPAPDQAICADVPTPPVPPDIYLMKRKLEAHQVRTPSSGYAGLAHLWRRRTKELFLTTDRLEHESQLPQFQVLCDAIHRRLSGLHYSGSLVMRSVRDYLALSDRGWRAFFGSGETGFQTGVVTEQSRFYGLVNEIEYDLDNGSTTISFDSAGLAGALKQGLLERLFVTETSELAELKARQKATEDRLLCFQRIPQPPSPLTRSGCTVSYDQQSIQRKVTTVDPKQLGLGTGETALGNPSNTTGNSGSTSGSTAFNPERVIERDFNGDAWAVELTTGANVGGVENGTQFNHDYDVPAVPQHLPQHTADSFAALQMAMQGMDLVQPPPTAQALIKAGSTTTVIQLRTAIPNDGRFDGGFMEIRYGGDRITRPMYPITSHTATTVTLASAMSEAAPRAGQVAMIWPERIPKTDADDFPNGGRPWKDTAGNWFVTDPAGVVTKADLVSGVLEAHGTNAPAALDLGNANVDLTVKGEIDFASATVVGLPGAGAPDVLTTKGDLLSHTGTSYKRVPKGGNDTFFGINGSGEQEYRKIPSGAMEASSVTTSILADLNVTESKLEADLCKIAANPSFSPHIACLGSARGWLDDCSLPRRDGRMDKSAASSRSELLPAQGLCTHQVGYGDR